MFTPKATKNFVARVASGCSETPLTKIEKQLSHLSQPHNQATHEPLVGLAGLLQSPENTDIAPRTPLKGGSKGGASDKPRGTKGERNENERERRGRARAAVISLIRAHV